MIDRATYNGRYLKRDGFFFLQKKKKKIVYSVTNQCLKFKVDMRVNFDHPASLTTICKLYCNIFLL